MTTTTLVALLKREFNVVTYNEGGDIEQQLNIKETYHLLLRIIMMKPIRILAAVLLTVKAGESKYCRDYATVQLLLKLTFSYLIYRLCCLRCCHVIKISRCWCSER